MSAAPAAPAAPAVAASAPAVYAAVTAGGGREYLRLVDTPKHPGHQRSRLGGQPTLDHREPQLLDIEPPRGHDKLMQLPRLRTHHRPTRADGGPIGNTPYALVS